MCVMTPLQRTEIKHKVVAKSKAMPNKAAWQYRIGLGVTERYEGVFPLFFPFFFSRMSSRFWSS